MGWSQVLTSGSGGAGAAVAAVGSAFTWMSHRRAQYDRVLAEMASLTTGEVAEARHRVGTHLESTPSAVLPGAVIKDLFTVLWVFERLYRSLDSSLPFSRVTRPQRLLLTASRGAVTIWHAYVRREFQDESGSPVDLSRPTKA